jgi:hypothetical protein
MNLCLLLGDELRLVCRAALCGCFLCVEDWSCCRLLQSTDLLKVVVSLLVMFSLSRDLPALIRSLFSLSRRPPFKLPVNSVLCEGFVQHRWGFDLRIYVGYLSVVLFIGGKKFYSSLGKRSNLYGRSMILIFSEHKYKWNHISNVWLCLLQR